MAGNPSVDPQGQIKILSEFIKELLEKKETVDKKLAKALVDEKKKNTDLNKKIVELEEKIVELEEELEEKSNENYYADNTKEVKERKKSSIKKDQEPVISLEEQAQSEFLASQAGKTPAEFAKEEQDKRADILKNQGITDQSEINSWENIGLTSNQIQQSFQRGWVSLTNPKNGSITNIKNDGTVSYTMSGQTVDNLNIAKYDKREIEMILQFVDKVKNPNKLSQMISDDLIRQKIGDGSKFPPNLQTEALIELRDNNIPQIFKKVFEQPSPSGLEDFEIENWRNAETGLSIDGDQQRKAYDNGWTDPSKITDGKTTYVKFGQTTPNIDVLTAQRNRTKEFHRILQAIDQETNHENLLDGKTITVDITNLKTQSGNNNDLIGGGRKLSELITVRDEKRKELINALWNSFFTIGKSIPESDQNLWKNSGLNIISNEPQTAWDNSWQDIKNNPIKGGLADYNLVGKNMNLSVLTIDKSELDKLGVLLSQIKNSTKLADLPLAENINTDVYDDDKVSAEWCYSEVEKILEEKTIELFQKHFEGNNPSGEKNIDVWRTKQTGLAKDALEERKAYDNGWTDPSKIRDRKCEYEIDNLLYDVVKVDKKELDKVTDFLNEILNLEETFKAYDQWMANNEAKIKELDEDKLSETRNQATVLKLFEEKRNLLQYVISQPNNEIDGDGLDRENWKNALALEAKSWKVEKRGTLDSKILNQFLKDNGIDVKPGVNVKIGEGKDATVIHDGDDISDWLKITNGAFDTKEETADYLFSFGVTNKETGEKISGYELIEQEEKWDLKAKGSLLLEYFYKKNNGWEPEDDKIENNFCEWKKGQEIEIEKKVRKKDPSDKSGKKLLPAETIKKKVIMDVVNDTKLSPDDRERIFGDKKKMPGHLAIGTGVGKTTKTTCCLVKGGERNIILVCPTKGLVSSAYKHHSEWLQTWGCVYHKINARKAKEEQVKTDERTGKKTINQVEVTRYSSHGSYQLKKNDIITEKIKMCDKDEKDNDIPGTEKERWGLSILEPGYLLGFLTRKIFSKNKEKDPVLSNTKPAIGLKLLEATNKFDKEVIDEIIKKQIPKDTIIVFDEAHYNSAAYQELIRDTIILGYKVIKMTATFPTIPFSITSTYPRKNLYMSQISSQYKEKGGMVVDFDKRLREGKNLVFLKNLQYSDPAWKYDKNVIDPKTRKPVSQAPLKLINTSALVAENIPHVIVTEDYEEFAESISHGMPEGCLIIVDNSKEMGFTFDIDTVIVSNWAEIPVLKPDWQYSEPEPVRLSLASMVQQIGRAARIKDGVAVILSTELEEPEIVDDIAVSVVRACLIADETSLKKVNKDLHILRGAVSLPGDSETKKGKFGLYPEELVIGVWGNEVLGKAEPKFHKDPLTFTPDKDLYAKHLGIWSPPPLKKEEAKEILKLMIQTYISKEKEFPESMDLEIKSSLIKAVDLETREVEPVLYKVVEDKLVEQDEELKENKEKEKWPATEKEVFKEVVAIHRFVLGAKIAISDKFIDPNNEKKGKQKVLSVQYKR